MSSENIRGVDLNERLFISPVWREHEFFGPEEDNVSGHYALRGRLSSLALLTVPGIEWRTSIVYGTGVGNVGFRDHERDKYLFGADPGIAVVEFFPHNIFTQAKGDAQSIEDLVYLTATLTGQPVPVKLPELEPLFEKHGYKQAEPETPMNEVQAMAIRNPGSDDVKKILAEYHLP